MSDSASSGTLSSCQADAAYEILDYNQQLIQFADAKAGNLIVINSLFIAAAQAGSGASPLPMKVVQGLLVMVAGLAVLQCLGVIMSRSHLPRMPRRDSIFYADIAQRRSPNQFVEDFKDLPAAEHAEDALRRVYVLALIARQKFSSFAWAQATTVVAALCWLTHSLLSLFF